jgi:hypothetical protein
MLNSNTSAPDGFDRREDGAFVVHDSASGEISLVPFPPSFVRHACEIEFPDGGFELPPGTIGMVHTHPFSIGDTTAYIPCTYRSIRSNFPWMDTDDVMDLAEDLANDKPYDGRPSAGDIGILMQIREQGVDLFGVVVDNNGYVLYDSDTDPNDLRSELENYEPCGFVVN